MSAVSATHLLPPNAYDTHVHVFDKRLGPYHPSRAYTPQEAPLEDLLSFESGINATGRPANIVLVQPSPYKYDNQVLLNTLHDLRRQDCLYSRGIAVFDPSQVTESELASMNYLGVRGLRLNVQADGSEVNIEAFKAALINAADRIKHLNNWKLQVYAPAEIWDALYDVILRLPVQVIADHLGGLKGASKLPRTALRADDHDARQQTLEQPGLDALIRLAQSSRVVVKISGLYRASSLSSEGYKDLEPIIQHLAEKIPDNLVWASDWPHTGDGKNRKLESALNDIEPFRTVDNERILANIRKWLGEEVWLKAMVYNPQKVYR